MKKLKKYIIILIIIIAIILLLLIGLLKLNSKKNEDENAIGDVGEIIEVTNQEEDEKDFSKFKNVENCIQKYYNIMSDNYFGFYNRNENGEYEKIDDKSIKQIRLDLLSSEYIKSNNINESNLYQYIKTFQEQYNIVTLKMKKIINDNVDQYKAYGLCLDYNGEVLDEFYIIVNVDTINKTFSIEPILNKPNSIDDIKLNNDNNEITTNDYNEYVDDIYNNENEAQKYLIFFKKLALAKPEILYNYMSDEYKAKRFENEENFLKYISDNIDEIQGLKMTKYLVNYKADSTEIVCKDQYDNVYIFDENLPMQFDFKLDNYTILTDKFKQTYEKSDNQEKVKMNIDRFIQMINRHDYMNSYKCISEGFKNNYFSSQDIFENFIKNNFYDYNKFEFKNIEQKGNNVYVCTVQLTSLMQENSEEKDINIIMQLNDNFDFEMSFVIE